MERDCEACKRARQVVVVASPFGPMSFALCHECLSHIAMPEWMLEYARDTNQSTTGYTVYIPQVGYMNYD